jgi:Rod binding domain-containing protein
VDIGPARLAAAAGAERARPGEDLRWEAALQTGRIPAGATQDRGFMRYLCRQLESAAVNAVFQAARRTASPAGPLSGGFTGQMFQGLADEEYSRLVAARGGFGVGDEVFRQVFPDAGAAGTGAAAGARRAAAAKKWYGYEEQPGVAPGGGSRSPGNVR